MTAVAVILRAFSSLARESNLEPRKPEETALVIGYGNPSRQDDGVGYHLVNALKRRLGQPELCEDQDGLDERHGPVNVIWTQQLFPELAEIIAEYDLVVFLDAHVEPDRPDLDMQPIQSAYRSSLVSHHTKPETLLALSHDLYQRTPRAILISVRGYTFDFGDQLSPQAQQLAKAALPQIALLIRI
jgi:hydrogenase maturation protease